MVRLYVTSITNDASGTLGARQAAFGATYPFPPRYVDRYMPATDVDNYTTRSFLFGGPWVFMNRLVDLSPDELNIAAREIQAFKRMRGDVRDGKVFHLTSAPAVNRTDAIQSVDPDSGRAVAVVTRDQTPGAAYQLRLRGLDPTRNYDVTFQDSTAFFRMTGAQLMNTGVRIAFTAAQDAEIVWVTPVSQ
jgi:alpha-galactosidase